MNITNKQRLFTGIVGGFILGGLVTVVAVYFGLMGGGDQNDMGTQEDVGSNNQPLYWVAPMDPNFKRDQPGQSPMGMALVPVYNKGDDNKGDENSPGTVKIDPSTTNNLGVKTTQVSLIKPDIKIRSYGQVQFAEDLIIHSHPRVNGWVESLYVISEGDYVNKGDPLYDLYSPELVNAQEELLIALKQNRKALISAAETRLAALNVSQTLIADLKRNQKPFQTVTFYAKQSGYISNLNIQNGFYVEPSMTLLAIAPLTKVWVLAQSFSSDGNKIKVGQPASVTTSFLPGQVFKSQVDYIYPALNKDTNTLTVRVSIPNPDEALKPNMFAEVTIDARQATGRLQNELILAVPTQAVIRTEKQDRVVLALGDGKFKSIEVLLGEEYGEFVQIVQGVVEGDEIVTSAQFLIDSQSSISSDFIRMETMNYPDDMMDAK